MAFHTSIFLLAFLLFYSSASAFNITDILDLSPDFSSFNSYLTQTLVAGEINARQTITVLAVDNSAMSAISGLPVDVIRNVLSVHVILDYYDVSKFQSLSNKTALLVTLFQATGLATGQMGFLNATDLPSGVALGSAEPGAGLNAMLVKAVATEPYNISVLQISSLIVPPGIGNLGQASPPPPPPPAPTPVVTPKPAPTPKKAPVPVAPGPSLPTPPPTASSPKSPAPSTAAEAPASPPLPAAPFPNSPAPSTPGEAPTSSPPPTSPSPESPLASAPARAPAAGAPANGGVSSGTRLVVGTGLAAAAAAAMGAALLGLAAF